MINHICSNYVAGAVLSILPIVLLSVHDDRSAAEAVAMVVFWPITIVLLTIVGAVRIIKGLVGK